MPLRLTIFLAALLSGLGFIEQASGGTPTDRPPVKGGHTYSLSMPSLYKPYAGFELQSYSTGDSGDLGGLLNAGVDKDLGNPIVGAAALGLEAYGGYRGQSLDGGGRAAFSIPSLLFGIGVDYNITDDSFDLLLRLDLTGRRGGVFGAGSTLAVRYLPTRDQTFSVGVSKPFWGRHLGRSRAKRDHVIMDDHRPRRLTPERASLSPELEAELTGLRERVRWVTRMTMPFAEERGRDAREAMKSVDEVRDHVAARDDAFPNGHTALEETRVYHETLSRAFALALSGGSEPTERHSELGRLASSVARKCLLEEVLLPYDRLLGQQKRPDSLMGLVSVAQTRFGRALLAAPALPIDAAYTLWFVFQSLCESIEAERAFQAERWEDSRFVWLPLQLALTADEYDTQAELDALIELAVEEAFTPENRIWYVVNESFQWEMARTVRLAEDYHVLWIHDYRGVDAEGDPDVVALAQTVNYLETMAERVKAYDETGRFPTYMILIDQHFFEINDGRRFLRLLERPLEVEVDLPDAYAEWSELLRGAQGTLRDAVEGSRLLQLEESQYGEDWLKNYIKVHVNVTNQADPSFYSLGIAGIVPVPDNNMRDHRKIAFFDVTEADPYRGLAMFTGMGIGEHYAGANWEDRAIMIQGPGALAVKTAARELFRTQGFEPEQIPWALRPVARPADYSAKIEAERALKTPDWMPHERGRVLQQHNETGFFDKPIEVTKAILYSLMPPGSVLQVPDSLWQNYLYASLLSGSSLRGARVLVMSPALAHAPAGGAANMARAHDLMARLIVFRNLMSDAIAEAGGILGVGLYAPQQGVGDIAGRVRQAVRNQPPWADRLFRSEEARLGVEARIDSLLVALDYQAPHEFEEGEERPKLHLKANFLMSREFWQAITGRPELSRVLVEHTRYLAQEAMIEANASISSLPEVRKVGESLTSAWYAMLHNVIEETPEAEREKFMAYLTVGSVNLDYRSMVLNAETMITVSGGQSLHGFVDFLLLPGLCEWVETTEELDALLPAPSSLRRWVSNFLRVLL